MSMTRVEGPRFGNIAGITKSFELVIRYLDWTAQLSREPTIAEIRARFGCSRATAYRWRSAHRAARGSVAA